MLLKDRLRVFDSVLPSGTMRPSYGSVAEWFKAAVLKTADSQGSQSSNLCASAIFEAPFLRGFLLSAGSNFKSTRARKKSSSEVLSERRRCLTFYSPGLDEGEHRGNPGPRTRARAELSAIVGNCLLR